MSCQDNPSGKGLVSCIDSTKLALPDQYTFGNAPRNMIRGLGYSRTDLSMMKAFTFAGRYRAIVQAQIFNVFNEVNWGAPGTVFGSSSFGVVSSALDMRQGEIGFKFTFQRSPARPGTQAARVPGRHLVPAGPGAQLRPPAREWSDPFDARFVRVNAGPPGAGTCPAGGAA